MNDHTFCRHWLKDTMAEVKAIVPDEVIKRAWVYKGTNYYEFGISGGTNFHTFVDKVDCKWSARARGWDLFLEKIK